MLAKSKKKKKKKNVSSIQLGYISELQAENGGSLVQDNESEDTEKWLFFGSTLKIDL